MLVDGTLDIPPDSITRQCKVGFHLILFITTKRSDGRIKVIISKMLGPLSLTRFHFNPSVDKLSYSITKYGMKLFIHSQILTLWFHFPLYWTCDHLSMPIVKSINVNKYEWIPGQTTDRITRHRKVVYHLLTHLPLGQMAAISQTIFADAFHEWKILYFD